ncbi:MAG TPA: S24 family peptidase, partial [Candidatus Saccharimonadales bacterium]|nr:S24 family peptidase [Candidatus Saccharimonadales bacterium]
LALDLNRLLVRQPASTFLFRVAGHHWAGQGIYDGDVAVVDRALRPKDSDLVVAVQSGNLVLCRRQRLVPQDDLWGVVTAVIHQFRRS